MAGGSQEFLPVTPTHNFSKHHLVLKDETRKLLLMG